MKRLHMIVLSILALTIGSTTYTYRFYVKNATLQKAKVQVYGIGWGNLDGKYGYRNVLPGRTAPFFYEGGDVKAGYCFDKARVQWADDFRSGWIPVELKWIPKENLGPVVAKIDEWLKLVKDPNAPPAEKAGALDVAMKYWDSIKELAGASECGDQHFTLVKDPRTGDPIFLQGR